MLQGVTDDASDCRQSFQVGILPAAQTALLYAVQHTTGAGAVYYQVAVGAVTS
jgi:hypothetical protein